MMKSKIVIVVLMLTASMFANADTAINNAATQEICKMTGTLPPDARWNTGGVETLNRRLDQTLIRKDIIAYQIQWSTGWSVWYVKGVNDLVNVAYTNELPAPGGENARLFWIYFSDHNHRYLSCQ
ncbi:conserved exported hypothetical protein [Gammaproteobacteria bacterium]